MDARHPLRRHHLYRLSRDDPHEAWSTASSLRCGVKALSPHHALSALCQCLTQTRQDPQGARRRLCRACLLARETAWTATPPGALRADDRSTLARLRR